MEKNLTIKVPASSANIGPGFDCLALALDIWNTITVSSGDNTVSINGYGKEFLTKNQSNLILKSFHRIFQETGQSPPSVHFECENNIPIGKGLGSSAASVIGGLIAGNQLLNNPFTNNQILSFASDIEGHPENAAAALLGGFQIVIKSPNTLLTSEVHLKESMKAILFIPEIEMPTAESRKVLKSTISRDDAIFNIGRAALLVNALSLGDLELLSTATEDRLHQPARQKIFLPMSNLFNAAKNSGALAYFLSGAGSTVIAFAQEKEFTIGYEMADAASKSGIDGEIRISELSKQGTYIS